MERLDAHAAIYVRWMQQWPGLSGGVGYSTDNNVAVEGQVADYFAKASIISFDAEQLTIAKRGKRKFLHEGLIEVRLTGPMSVGRGPLDVLADHVSTIYNATRFADIPGREQGITTEATSAAELRRDPESVHRWILTCTTPFRFTRIG